MQYWFLLYNLKMIIIQKHIKCFSYIYMSVALTPFNNRPIIIIGDWVLRDSLKMNVSWMRLNCTILIGNIFYNFKAQAHICDLCDKPLSFVSAKKNHVLSGHLKEQPYRCPTCSKRFAAGRTMSIYKKFMVAPGSGVLIRFRTCWAYVIMSPELIKESKNKNVYSVKNDFLMVVHLMHTW